MDRKQFYNSKRWKQLADTYRLDKYNICERCGHPTWRMNNPKYKQLKAQGKDVRYGIVHHKEYIDDVKINNAYVTLNYNNLELLCSSCHNEEHFNKSLEVRNDVMFDEEGNVIAKEK